MKKLFKRSLALWVSSCVTFSIFASTATATMASVDPSEKFDDKLVEALSEMRDDEKVTVRIELSDISEKEIFTELEKQTGMDPEIYEDPIRFEEERVPEIRKEIESKIGFERANLTAESDGYEEAVASDELLKNLDLSISLADRAANADMEKYMHMRNKLLSERVSEEVDEFVSGTFDEDEKVLFSSECIELVIAEVSKSRIYEIAANSNVQRINCFVNENLTSADNLALTQIGADAETGTNSQSFSNGQRGRKFEGTGVKIGVIEAQNGRYDPAAYQLNASHNAGKLQYIQTGVASPTISMHATIVTSILAGSIVTDNGNIYRGVVPNATVYQTGITDTFDVLNAIEELVVGFDVTVINFSAGVEGSSTYNDFDKDVDSYITKYKVNFIVAAGNEGSSTGYVRSPGKAYNAITVGNANTKSGLNVALPTPYNMSATSSYVTAGSMPNKPDVCAPGVNIYVKTTETSHTSSSGTSCAAPLVTGMVAQMVQHHINPRNTTAIKNYVLLGASNGKISGTSTLYGAFKQKSGAGFVDAVKSVNQVLGDNWGYNSWPMGISSSASTGVYNNVCLEPITIEAGQKIRAVMYWQNEHGVANFSDLDFRLVNSSGSQVAYSSSVYSNVEIFEYTATSTGTFTVQYKLYTNKIPSSKSQYVWISWCVE